MRTHRKEHCGQVLEMELHPALGYELVDDEGRHAPVSEMPGELLDDIVPGSVLQIIDPVRQCQNTMRAWQWDAIGLDEGRGDIWRSTGFLPKSPGSHCAMRNANRSCRSFR